MKGKLSVSLFSADFLHIEEDLIKISSSNADSVHVDVMDGDFVELYGLNQNWLKAAHQICPRKADIHFMTKLSERRIKAFLYDYVETVTIHLEAAPSEEMKRYLELIHGEGKRAGIAISPGTDVKEVIPFLKCVDEVLVMTCEPGKIGSVYLPEMVLKIRDLDRYRTDKRMTFLIAVDGGITEETAVGCMEAGAGKLIVGRCFYQNPLMQSLFS